MQESKIKGLFFAQYWGQVVQFGKYDDEPHNVGMYGFGWHLIDTDYLQLRSISDLTDRQAIQIADFFIPAPNSKFAGRRIAKDLLDSKYVLNDLATALSVLVCYDYLRSIGILLPFTYLNDQNKPVTMSTDEILEKGWACLK